MQDLLLQIQLEFGRTIIFITHDLDEALKLGNQIVILKDGKISQIGSPENIVMKPRNDYVRSFLANVNKLQVMKAKHVMISPEVLAYPDTTLEELLETIREENSNDETQDTESVCILDPDTEQFLGVIKVAQLEGMSEESLKETSAESIMHTPPTVQENETLAAIIDTCLQSLVEIAVLNNEGKFSGIISRAALSQAVVGNITSDTETFKALSI